MGIIDKIRSIFEAEEPKRMAPLQERPEDSYLGTQLSTTGVVADVSTPANDPALRDVGAGGVQPVSKPVEIEREQDPEARRGNEVVRKP